MFPVASFLSFVRRIIVFALLGSLLSNTLFAAPESILEIYNRTGVIEAEFIRVLQGSGVGFNSLFLGSIYKWLPEFGKKGQEFERIIIEPSKEDGTLRVMQGEKVVFSATAYSGENPVNGVSFRWTVQDENREQALRMLDGGVFQMGKPGRYIVTAAAESGQQSQVLVSVIFSEGYHLQKIIDKDPGERTERENRIIASMTEHQFLEGRHISSRNSYDANDELLRFEADRRKRAIVAARQELLRKEFPEPPQTTQGRSSAAKENPDSNESKNLSGPSAENSQGIEKVYKNLDEREVNQDAERLLALMRPADEDGWNGSNWYTADDPGNATGRPAGAAPDAGTGNGNFTFSAPVLSLPGRGIDVSLALVYNSRLWSKSGTEMTYDSDKGWPAPGWSLGFGKMMYMGGTGGCMLVTPDGTRRSYDGTSTVYSGGTYYSSYYSGHTTDGSFIDFTCSYFSSTYGSSFSGTATLANGTTIIYSSPTSTYDQVFPTQITDAQGNYIDISYRGNAGPQISTVTDTAGRVITFNYEGATDRLISIDGPGYNGTTRTYVRLHYSTLSLSYAFATGYTTDTATDAPEVLDAIYYPGTDTGYWFGDSDSYSSYGMLAKVIQQRGMSFSGIPSGTQGTIYSGTMTDQKVYNFTLSADSTLTDAPTYTKMTESWASMDTSLVETNYNVSTGTDQVITVTLPDGTVNKQTSYASGSYNGYYYQGEVYASGSATTPLTTTKTYFGAGDYGSSRPTKVEVTDENGHTTATTFTYASGKYNQLITQKEYGYGTVLYRQTNNTYENDSHYINRHIFNLLKSAETVNASGTRLSRTEYEYDNNAVVNGTGSPGLMNTPGVIMHKDTSDPFTTNTHTEQGECTNWQWNYPACTYEGEIVYGPPWPTEYICMQECLEYEELTVSNYDPNSIFRGNVTKTTVYSDAAGLTGAISHDFTYDITGNQRTATTDCCQEMSFDYSDSFSDLTDHHAYAYPTAHTKGSSNPSSPLRMTESAVYDFNTGVIISSTDFNGIAAAFTYDSLTRPTTTTLHTGATSTTTYDDANLAVDQTSKLADGTTIVGRSVTQVNGRGQTVLSKYLAGATNWNATQIKYDEMGRKWKISMPFDASGSPSDWTEYAYDALSRATQVTAPDGSTSKTFYNESSRPDSASASLGQTVRSQDAWGRERWARTDDFGRLVEVVEPNPIGTATTSPVNVALASNGATVTASSTHSSGNFPASAAINGDRKGAGWGSGTGGWNDNTYNTWPDWLQVNFSGSRTINEIDVFTVQDDSVNPSEPTETMTFTEEGIVNFTVQYWDASASAWTTVSGGSVTGNDKVWKKFTFSDITTDKIRVTVNGSLNYYSRITELEAWTPTVTSGATGSVFDPGSLKTSYSYDQLDQLTGVSQGVQTRSFKYDSLGRMTRQKLAEQTATINDAGVYVGAGGTGANWSDAFSYDDHSNITQRIDARGVKTNFSYMLGVNADPFNRLQEISYDTSTADTTYTIAAAPTVSLEYMTSGDQSRVKKVTTAGVAVEENAYDSESRISDYTMTLSSRSSYPMQTSYSYDTANRLTQITYPAQYGIAGSPRKTVSPSYDQTSRLTQLNVDSQVQLSDIAYNAFGQVTQLKTGAATGNADIEQYSYDGQTGLLTNQKVYKASNMTTPILDLSYAYNRGNSIGTGSGKTGQMTHVTNNLDHNKDRVYEFDALGRLIKAKGGLATGITGVTADWTQNYSYDRYGNKTGVTASGGMAGSTRVPKDGIGTLGYNTASNRINDSGWEYDNAGNMIRGKNASTVWQKFEYDAAGRLVKVKDDSNNVLETYTYGADRSRLICETNAGRTYYAWGGSNPLQEYVEATASTTPVYSKSYVYAGSRLLSTDSNTGSGIATEFQHPDRMGTKLVTDPVANTYFEQSTLPFGTALSAESTGFTNQTFTSYDRSGITGLDYAVNRTHSPGQGRFTQVDPIGMNAAVVGNPQSNNLFAYTQNMPTDFIDPSGLNMIAFTMTVCLPWDGGPHICFDIVIHWMDIGGGGSSNGGDNGGGGGVIMGDCDKMVPADKPPDASVRSNIATTEATVSRLDRAAQAAAQQVTSRGIPLDAAAAEAITVGAKGIDGAVDKWFYGMVAAGNPWDYKRNGNDKYEDFGNFNYGAVGAAAGYSSAVLERMAGWVQADGTGEGEKSPSMLSARAGVGGKWPFGDEVKDNTMIMMGIAYFKCIKGEQ